VRRFYCEECNRAYRSEYRALACAGRHRKAQVDYREETVDGLTDVTCGACKHGRFPEHDPEPFGRCHFLGEPRTFTVDFFGTCGHAERK